MESFFSPPSMIGLEVPRALCSTELLRTYVSHSIFHEIFKYLLLNKSTKSADISTLNAH